MRHHLRLIEPSSRPRRLNSREELLEWAEERRRVLTALVEAEKRGLGTAERPEQLTFDVEEAA